MTRLFSPGGGPYCPWPLMSDGWAHEVVDGICTNCGGIIWPRIIPSVSPLPVRTGHYRLVPKQ